MDREGANANATAAASARLRNRSEAGRALGQALAALALPPPIVVLALPRGGVPVAVEVARALDAQLEVLLVRKIGAPWNRELAVAAVVDGTPPDIVVDERTRRSSGTDRATIDAAAERALVEIGRRRRLYMGERVPSDLHGCTAVVVDDGIATGTTVRAALKALRRRQPQRLVLAVPVAPPDTVAALRPDVDELVCLRQPSPFEAVGLHYDDFHQLSDDEVLALLRAAGAGPVTGPASPGSSGQGRG